MGIKDQFRKIADNWLILLLFALAVFFVLGMGSIGSVFMSGSSVGQKSLGLSGASYDSYERGYAPTYGSGGFAPDVKDRKITKTASLSTEVEHGSFRDAESRLKSIAQDSASFILNENVNKQDSGRKSYYSGVYTIKVDTAKYDSVTSQLKGIGEVKSFYESSDDITGTYTDLATELAAEKARLSRFQKLYDEATLTADKITLNSNLFDQERRVAMLEDMIKNMDQQVVYSTITVSITEKRSDYADIAFAKFSSLVTSMVHSLNSLLYLIFIAVPYAVAALLIWLVVKAVKKKSR